MCGKPCCRSCCARRPGRRREFVRAVVRLVGDVGSARRIFFAGLHQQPCDIVRLREVGGGSRSYRRTRDRRPQELAYPLWFPQFPGRYAVFCFLLRRILSSVLFLLALQSAPRAGGGVCAVASAGSAGFDVTTAADDNDDHGFGFRGLLESSLEALQSPPLVVP